MVSDAALVDIGLQLVRINIDILALGRTRKLYQEVSLRPVRHDAELDRVDGRLFVPGLFWMISISRIRSIMFAVRGVLKIASPSWAHHRGRPMVAVRSRRDLFAAGSHCRHRVNGADRICWPADTRGGQSK